MPVNDRIFAGIIPEIDLEAPPGISSVRPGRPSGCTMLKTVAASPFTSSVRRVMARLRVPLRGQSFGTQRRLRERRCRS